MLNKVINKVIIVSRVVLGLIFFIFGLNGFFAFLPQPPMPEAAGAFAGALAATGYMFPLLKSVEVASGILLLANRYVPLALVLLAPVVVNIVGFHLFLAPPNGVTALVLGLELVLAWAYRDHFRSVLIRNAMPS
jgi:hypothetical protein